MSRQSFPKAGDTKRFMMKFPDKVQSFPSDKKQFLHSRSLFIKLSIVTILLIFILSLVLTLLFTKRQEGILYRERVSEGEMFLGHFANNAILPLLEDDTLALNTLVREAKQGDGLLYAMIVDSKKIIRAHTDSTKIGRVLKEFGNIEDVTKKEPITYLTYRLPSGTRVLNLSRPITFTNKDIGSAYVGLSADFINSEITKETSSMVRDILFVTLMMMIAGMVTALFLSRHLSRSGGDLDRALPLGSTMRNQVAVLYAGIKGFKAYADTRVPEEVLQDLSEYASIATKSILDCNGYVAKIIGDAVVGVFRSTPLQEDYIERAVRSAMAMQNALEKKKRSRNQLLRQVGIGISSGVVLSGYIASRAEKKYNDIGETFKVAHSLNGVAGPGEIVVSKEVYQSIKSLVSVEPLPPREMTERTEAWESFRLRNVVNGGADG